MKIKSEYPLSPRLPSGVSQVNMKLEDIDSVVDVKKMLYRCRTCGISCSSKAQYRQHTATHMHSDSQETPKTRNSGSSEKVPVLGASKKNKSQLVKSEFVNVEGDIQVTSLKEEVSDGEDDVKVLTLTSSASGPPVVKIEDTNYSGGEEDKKSSKEALSTSQLSTPPPSSPSSPSSPPSLPSPSPSKPSLPKKSIPKKSIPKKSMPKKPLPKKSLPKKSLPKKSLPKKSLPSQSASKTKGGGSGFKRRGQHSKGQRKMVEQQGTVGKEVGQSKMVVPKKIQCPECSMSFKTRSEMSFHMRFDH